MFTSADRIAFNGLKTTVQTLGSSVKSAASAAAGASTTANSAMSTVKTISSQVRSAQNQAQTAQSQAQTALQQASSAMMEASAAMNETRVLHTKGPDPETANMIARIQNELGALKTSMLVQTCSELGTQDGDMRIYSAEECDAMSGIYHANGECTRKEGGSFSLDCGQLYKGQASTKKAVNVNAAAKNAAAKVAATNAAIKNAAARNAVAKSVAYGEPAVPKYQKGVLPAPPPMFATGPVPTSFFGMGGRRSRAMSRRKRSKSKQSRRRK